MKESFFHTTFSFPHLVIAKLACNTEKKGGGGNYFRLRLVETFVWQRGLFSFWDISYAGTCSINKAVKVQFYNFEF